MIKLLSFGLLSAVLLGSVTGFGMEDRSSINVTTSKLSHCRAPTKLGMILSLPPIKNGICEQDVGSV